MTGMRGDNIVEIARSVCCPRCGYDLRGLPEPRCPECGERGDEASIRALARAHFEASRGVRRFIMWCSVVALLPVITWLILFGAFRIDPASGVAAVLILKVVLIGGMIIWVARRGWLTASRAGSLGVVMLVLPGGGLLLWLLVLPFTALPLMVLALAGGWIAFLRAPRSEPFIERTLTAKQRGILRRECGVMWVLFGMAHVVPVLFVCWA